MCGQGKDEVAFPVQAVAGVYGGQVIPEENETRGERFTGE